MADLHPTPAARHMTTLAPVPSLPLTVVLACACLVAGAVNYAVALTFSNGFVSLPWLIASMGTFLLTLGALMILRRPRLGSPVCTRNLLVLVGLCVLLQLVLILLTPPSDAFEKMTPLRAWSLRGAAMLIGVAGVAAALVRGRRLTLALLLLAVAIHAVIGVILINSGFWMMDVIVFHQDSAAAFLRGENPYAITFPNIYGEDAWVYSKQVMDKGRVLFGFPYPPLTFFAYLPSYWLTSLFGEGESRYAHLAAIGLAALVTWRIGRSAFSVMVAVMILTVPVGWRVIGFAWTEPFLILFFAIVAWAGIRHPKLLPYALGAFLCSKQYCIIFVPLVWPLLPRPMSVRSSGVFLLKMIGTGAVLSLPLALWDWGAFWNSNVTIQVMQPFRPDSFSFLALYYEEGKPPPSSMIPFLALLPVYAFVWLRSERSVGGFALALALTDMVFLFTNRQAFLNYHLFAQVTLLIAAVTIAAENSDETRRREVAKDASM